MKLKLTDSGIIVAKSISTIKAEAGDQDGVIDFVASTNSVDRDKDIVRQDGLILDFYKSNPVFLWAHMGFEPPVGQSLKSEMNEEGNFQIKVLFDLDDEFASKIYRKYKKGFMRMVSIGFIPHELEERETERGFVFTKTEIMEVSAVPVGSNREALAIERGQDAQHTKHMSFGQWLKENPDCIIKPHPVTTNIKSSDTPEEPEDAPEEPEKNAPEDVDEPDKAPDTPEEPVDESPETPDKAPEDTPEETEKGADVDDESEGENETEAPGKDGVFELFGKDGFEGFTVMTDDQALALIKSLPEPIKARVTREHNIVDVTKEGDESEQRDTCGAVYMSFDADEAVVDEDTEKGSETGDSESTIHFSDEFVDALATKLAEKDSNTSRTVVLNLDANGFAGKSAEQVAKAINDLLGSKAHEADEPSEEDSPNPVKLPDASGPKPATLTVVSGNQD